MIAAAPCFCDEVSSMAEMGLRIDAYAPYLRGWIARGRAMAMLNSTHPLLPGHPVSLWDKAALALLGLLALLSLPGLIVGTSPHVFHPYSEDAVIAHLPQINYFVGHPFDLKSYPSTVAMTPGHHLLLAWGAALLGYDSVSEATPIVMILNAVMGFAFLATAWLILRRLGAEPWTATGLAAPIACSNYVVSGTIWISTDNGALFFYALTLYAVMFAREKTWLTGLSGALLVLWRQIYLPVLGVHALALLYETRRPTAKQLMATAWALIPPVLLMFYFYAIWGGLTPPMHQHDNRSEFAPGVPLQAFALLGLYALPFGFYLWAALKDVDRRSFPFILGAVAAVIFALWLGGDTDYNKEMGRWGSLVWVLAAKGPVLAGHSPIVLLLALAGGAVLSVMFAQAAKARYFPAAAIMLALYILGYSVQILAWQRYLEPQVFLTLAIFAAQSGCTKKLALIGPVVFAALLGLMTAARTYGTLDQLFG
jgi:hypothetical protein